MATKRKGKIKRYADGSVDAEQFLEELTGGLLTFAEMLKAVRLGEGMSQTDFAEQLEISRQHLWRPRKGPKVSQPRTSRRVRTGPRVRRGTVRSARPSSTTRCGRPPVPGKRRLGA